MKRKLAYVICFLICCCSQKVRATRLQMDRSMASRRYYHQRSLSAVYHLEICRWIQDASCQLNPRYARHLLSGSNTSDVQEAILSDAECLSMTHEAACISRETCEWVRHDPASEGVTHSLCQSSNKRTVVRECVVSSLRAFVTEYMACRRQMGGSCKRENNCEIVNLSQDDQGCGIKGTRVLDSIINTPASQTELVAHLVQVATNLRSFELPELNERATNDRDEVLPGGRRMILETNSSSAGSRLAVREDDFTSTGTSARTKPTIQGTGGDEEEDTEAGSSKSSTRKGQKRGKNDRSVPDDSPDSEDSPASSSTPSPEKEEQTSTIAGSRTFNVSEHIGSHAEESGQDKDSTSKGSSHSFDETPLFLAGPTDHLIQTDIELPVSLADITKILTELVSLMEEEQEKDSAFDNLSIIARDLDIMRFRLDSQTVPAPAKAQWNTSDALWWSLQKSAESLDAAYTEDAATDRTIMSNLAQTLLDTVHQARQEWRPRFKSKEHKRLKSVESKLETILNRGPSQRQPESAGYTFRIIENLDKLIVVVVEAFNMTLQEIYPSNLSLHFSEKYDQTWVQIFIKRIQKWHAIRKDIAADGTTGDQIVKLVQGLYCIHKSQPHYVYLPTLEDLGSIVNDIVGATVASHSAQYKIHNLPEEMKSPGLEVWQRGHIIDAEMLNDARRKANQNLEKSKYVEFVGFPPVSDKVNGLFGAVIELIDAKLPHHAGEEIVPEHTTILRTMEAGLNVITDWNKFALANNLERGAVKALFGNEGLMEFTLSLVGCLTLGSTGDGQCRNMDRSPCGNRSLPTWSGKTEGHSSENSDLICAPDRDTKDLLAGFNDIPFSSAENLSSHVTEVYLITAYCPLLNEDECKSDERCSYLPVEGNFVCRPSSNFINFLVEENQITGLVATNESCREYIGLPVCGNLKSQDVCSQSPGCLWTQPDPAFDGSGPMCIADWFEQLRMIDQTTTLQDSNLLNYNLHECQVLKEEKSCRGENTDPSTTSSVPPTSNFPRHDREVPKWLAFLLSVLAAIGVVWMLYAVRKIAKKQGANDGRPGKKGKGKKKGDQVSIPRGPPVPMHALEIEPVSGTSTKKDDFDFVMEVFRTEPNSFSNSSRPRFHSPDTRSDRNINNSIGEISEIQPDDSDSTQSSTDSEESDEDVGWTSSSEDLSDEEDAVSLPDL